MRKRAVLFPLGENFSAAELAEKIKEECDGLSQEVCRGLLEIISDSARRGKRPTRGVDCCSNCMNGTGPCNCSDAARAKTNPHPGGLTFTCANCGKSAPMVHKVSLRQDETDDIMEICPACAAGPKCVKCHRPMPPQQKNETVCFECALGVPSEDGAQTTNAFGRARNRGQHGAVLKEAFNIINGERQDVYGNPEDSFDRIADYWSTYLGDRLSANLSAEDAVMMMVLFKVAREQNQHKRDNLVDIAGYVGILETVVNKTSNNC